MYFIQKNILVLVVDVGSQVELALMSVQSRSRPWLVQLGQDAEEKSRSRPWLVQLGPGRRRGFRLETTLEKNNNIRNIISRPRFFQTFAALPVLAARWAASGRSMRRRRAGAGPGWYSWGQVDVEDFA